MQVAHRVAKNTGILYARMAITVFISLYSTRLVLAALGVTDFGLFNVVGGVISMLGFLNSSMAGATQRFMSFAQGAGDLEKVKRIFNMSTLLHAGIAILMVIVLEIAGYFFLNGVLNIEPERLSVAKTIYQFMVVSTFFTVLSVPYEAVITSHENMFFYAILGIIESGLKLGIAIYLAFSAYDHLFIYGLLMAMLSIFLLILRRVYCHRNYDECVFNFRKYYEKALMKEVSSFAGWSLLGASTSMIGNYGQGIVLNVFFGTIANAGQAIAGQVSGQLGAFAATMITALNPSIDKSEGAGNREMMLKAAMIGSKASFFLLILFVIPVMIEMQYIFKIWLKEIPEYAIVFCTLYLVRHLIDQLFVVISATISAVGNIRRYQIFTSILNFFPLLITFVLFKLGYPPYTMYLVFIVYSIIKAYVNVYFSKVYCGLPIIMFFKQVFLRCVLSFAIIYILCSIPLYFFDEGATRLSIVLTINLISFIGVIFLIGLTGNERTKLRQFIYLMIGKINQILK
ncbi:MAG: O-antigen/teichoic acid export membrane protein [Flavobacteriales bacterium]|jgi:O-antigen/teichoic acid export membrane protein